MARTPTNSDDQRPVEHGDAFEPPASQAIIDQPTNLKHASAENGEHKPRSTIAMPLGDGSVAHYTDEGNFQGVGISREHPDPNFRPSSHVLEPLKEEHQGVKKHRWDKPSKSWIKRNIGNNPVAERLDSEERFEEVVKRSREEIDKSR